MHDRRIDGEAHIFGNHGSMCMNAMTWYDLETGSVWWHPTGLALIREYKGVKLDMVPASIVPSATWKK